MSVAELAPTRESATVLKAKDAPDLSRFHWDDPFRLDDQLEPDERMLRDAARNYAAKKLAPRVIADNRNEAVVPEIFAEMGEHGVAGCHHSREVRRPRCLVCHLRSRGARDRADR